MAWSAENATRAYLQTLEKKDHKNAAEPNVAEFISAMAAGNCSHVMVDVCSRAAGPTTLALVMAAQQTGSHVLCIVPTESDVRISKLTLGELASSVEFIVGDSIPLLQNHEKFQGSVPDFVLVDCKLRQHKRVFAMARETMAGSNGGGGVVVGYNAAMGDNGVDWGRMRAELLPIGGGLRVSRVMVKTAAVAEKKSNGSRRSNWVVRVDEFTGEEHVFRIKRWIQA